jgi:hypothetical protein
MIHALVVEGVIERFSGTSVDVVARLAAFEAEGRTAAYLFSAASDEEFCFKQRTRMMFRAAGELAETCSMINLQVRGLRGSWKALRREFDHAVDLTKESEAILEQYIELSNDYRLIWGEQKARRAVSGR